MRRRPWDDEDEAGQLIVAHLGGEYVQRDRGGGPSPVHDLDVHVDGRSIAVEVTRHNVPSKVKQDDAVSRRPWLNGELTWWWQISIGPVANVKRLHDDVGRLLQALEAEGVREVAHGAGHDLTPAGSELLSLGVRYATAISDQPPEPGVENPLVNDAAAAGSTHPDLVVAAVEDHANRPDNIRKLESADADERHLFVWVENSHHQIVAAMAGWLPDRAPDLPDVVDVVWVVTAFDRPTAWRYSRAQGWEAL